jgi:beta-aspartyl-peptidase (threonine type)
MFALQDTFSDACLKFFQTEMTYDYVLSPVTSDCISSPMGLASDSLPVQIPPFGRNTYLADSMQFTLEYMLRVKGGSNGMYYISPSFRGEDPDSTHLNQFYHVECELPGDMGTGREVMERFVISVAHRTNA